MSYFQGGTAREPLYAILAYWAFLFKSDHQQI